MVFHIKLRELSKLLVLNTRVAYISCSPSRYAHTKGYDSSCKQNILYMEPCCKVAVITGGSDGIGFATAQQLLCCKAKHVALIGLDIARGLDAVNTLNCSHGKNKATFIKCDVRNKEAVDDTFLKIKNEFKKVDIIVSAAGIWNEQKWQEQIQTNLIGTINVNLAVQECFRKSNTVVINIAGLSGIQPFPYSPIFASGSTGIVKLSQSFGHPDNFVRTGIRVVALCAGITSTTLIKDVDQRMLNPEMGKELKEFLKTAICQKPDAVAKAVLEVVKFGATHTVWLVEGSRLLHLEMPDWRKHCVLVSQFT
ncbi:15-hydroxyprostaglandin dehydrogenase [NAD(+)] [Leptinotarsa decemlineata]|uniref:15-hydroxyprostaglandin dehydrogenase [NAD(+)] n=1 Tax=Leptinotarsa decemlineata TaxID=7539 RepID=UPI000C2541F0|nr:15-hydroxyprostaglandin dehydrogenase [NAD(+)]-like [Leptinotarsa decemlineata]